MHGLQILFVLSRYIHRPTCNLTYLGHHVTLTGGQMLALANEGYHLGICFDGSCREEYDGMQMILLLSNVTRQALTSQVRSKSKLLRIWRIWFCRALQPYRMEISQYNNIGRVWDTSKYHPMLSLSIFKVKRSKKGQTNNFVFGQRERCFKVTFAS